MAINIYPTDRYLSPLRSKGSGAMSGWEKYFAKVYLLRPQD